MQQVDNGAEWATIAFETFEHGVVPWAGRPYAPWVRTWSRPHPGDPRGLTQVPEKIYRAFQTRTPGERLSLVTAKGLGYPAKSGRLTRGPHHAVNIGTRDALPLGGVRVVAWEHAVAAPLATRH